MCRVLISELFSIKIPEEHSFPHESHPNAQTVQDSIREPVKITFFIKFYVNETTPY